MLNEASAKPIKSFLYLDEYKMYSISSQLFGGLTEYLVNYEEITREEQDSDNIPSRTGRVMADILKSESGTQARKYLHDYSYTLFEQALKAEGRVLSISAGNLDEAMKKLDYQGFIEVKAPAKLNDIVVLKSTIADFNNLISASVYASNIDEITLIRQQLQELTNTTQDRNAKVNLRARLKELSNPHTMAQKSDQLVDPQLIEAIALWLDYGLRDQFEIRLPLGQYEFCADIVRGYLREEEHLFVRKYSRTSLPSFVLFGTVARASDITPKPEVTEPTANETVQEPTSLKNAILTMAESLTELEVIFTGQSEHEIIIDPIAVYREL